MASLNKVMLIGRLGQSPNLQYTQDGMAICKFNIATDESYISKSGEKIEKTEWHRIVLFNKNAENANLYLSKGSLVFIEGALSTRQYTDKNNIDRYITEVKCSRIRFLDSKKSNINDYKNNDSEQIKYNANFGNRGEINTNMYNECKFQQIDTNDNTYSVMDDFPFR